MQRRDEEVLGLHLKEAITFWSVTLFFKCYPTNYAMQKGSSNIVLNNNDCPQSCNIMLNSHKRAVCLNSFELLSSSFRLGAKFTILLKTLIPGLGLCTWLVPLVFDLLHFFLGVFSTILMLLSFADLCSQIKWC
jgi:hypothetical protein